jgi:ornithine carbamoyltransferase
VTRHFLAINDLTTDELTNVLDLAERWELPQVLRGKGAALLFEKPSSRTRHSVEMAVVQLGGHPIVDTVELGKRETVEDLTRVLVGYHALIAARVFDHRNVAKMAAISSKVPVLNMLSDYEHPLQGLADLLTLRQEFNDLAGLRIAWLGEFNNVARSLSRGIRMLGGELVACCPEGYGPRNEDHVPTIKRPEEAVEGARCVVTDTWYSMGWEKEADERRPVFRPYQITSDLLSRAEPDAVFLHCLPAHRGEEATDDVLDSPQSRIFPEAHNRMHTARAIVAFLLGVR